VADGWSLPALTQALAAAGCVAAEEEAEELLVAAQGTGDLDAMVARRLTGEPIAWITGRTRFCGLDLAVAPGVYVPRWQSEPLARRAAELLPPAGVGVDLCTGSGAIGVVMQSRRPQATIVGTEIDPIAAACARANGLVVYDGFLDDPLPATLASRVDVMAGVLPYVPREAMAFLPRDVLHFEPRRALDGGAGGLQLVSATVLRSRRWLAPGGWLLLEVGSDQIDEVAGLFRDASLGEVGCWQDDDDDRRGVAGRQPDGTATAVDAVAPPG
jgi:release factor glutamine methyltransferase